ncbi:hypothetical protein [Streptomyces flavofungini]|uniref:hypothetical protein n=1 Tax=Streptomyces flavofungini TaxID=68200 RepID=UPI0025AEE6A5|nr:hypothetical protein [Streptomyces flavofungini]WJV45623.1 hypothetical protein QUY26_08810 [Streptomyces flavofungini]
MTGGRSCHAVRAAVFAAACVLLAATGHALMSSSAPLPWWALPGAGGATFAGAWLLAGRERGVLAVTSASVVAQAALHTWFSLAQAMTQSAAGGGASIAQQWARHLLCGAGGTGMLPEADAVRAVTDAGLADRLHGPPPGHTTRHSMGMQETVDPGASGLSGSGGPHASMGHGVSGTHDPSAALAGSGSGSGSGMTDVTDTTGMADMTGMPGMSGMPGTHSGHDMGGMSPLGMLAAHLLAALLCGLWLAYGERAAFRVGRAVAGWLVAPLRLALRLPQPPHRPRLRPRRDFGARRARRLLLVHAITSRGPPLGIAVV